MPFDNGSSFLAARAAKGIPIIPVATPLAANLMNSLRVRIIDFPSKVDSLMFGSLARRPRSLKRFPNTAAPLVFGFWKPGFIWSAKL
jgi:hypothetical protein